MRIYMNQNWWLWTSGLLDDMLLDIDLATKKDSCSSSCGYAGVRDHCHGSWKASVTEYLLYSFSFSFLEQETGRDKGRDYLD